MGPSCQHPANFPPLTLHSGDRHAFIAEHTASKPALLFFIKGEAVVGLGDDMKDAGAGTFVHMSPGLKHSIKAKTPVVMLLVLLK